MSDPIEILKHLCITLKKTALNLLKDTSDDLYAENPEDTDVYFHSLELYKALGKFLDISGIDFEEVETETAVNSGITECCGYDFGEVEFKKNKPMFCPMCGKKIVKFN